MNQTKKQVVDALAMTTLPHDGMAAHIAATLIVGAVVPSMDGNPGAAFYRLKAEAWLSMLLASEPGMSLVQLTERVCALTNVSEKVKSELGGLAGRLHLLAPEAA